MMKFPLVLKIGLVLSLLAVGFSSSSIYIFYWNTYQLILEQMSEKIRDTAYAKASLLDKTAKVRIQRLSAALEKDSLPLTPELLALAEGETVMSLIPEVAERYIVAEDFKYLVNLLNKIKYLGRQPKESDQQLFKYAYLLVTVPQAPEGRVLKFIADADYDEAANPNPPGNLYGAPPIFIQALKQQTELTNDFYTDQWGTFLSGVIPIQDEQHTIIALLGVDMDARSEMNKINQLKSYAFTISLISLSLALVFGFTLAGWLTQTLKRKCITSPS